MSRGASVRSLLAGAFTVGAMGFGGGAALIPIMEREFVQRHKLADDKAFTAHTIIANVTPGAQPVKMSAMVGTHTRPIWAPALAALVVALPGTVATVVLLAAFAALGESAIRLVEFAAVGISAFIAVLLVHYIQKVLRSYATVPSVLIMLATFAVVGGNQAVEALGRLLGTGWETLFPQLGALHVILLALLAVAVIAFVRRGRTATAPAPVVVAGASSTRHTLRGALVLAALAVAALGASFLVGAGHIVALIGASTLSSFGGGAAYIGVADGFFVASGLVPQAEFYGQMVPVANAMPGPVLIKLATAIGYGHGAAQGGVALGALVAMLAFLVAVCSCSALALVFLAVYERVRESAFVQALGGVVLPVICGLLLSTIASMLNASITIGTDAGTSGLAVGWGSIVGALILWAVQRRWTPNDVVLILAAGAASLTILLLATV